MSKNYGSLLRRLAAKVLGLMLSPARVKAPLPLKAVTSVLIFRNDAFGDAVVTTPLWRSLKRAKPSIRIAVVASQANHIFLAADPDIDQLFVTAQDGKLDRGSIEKIRKTKWDVTLCLKYNNKTKCAFLAHRLAPRSGTSTVAFNEDPRYNQMFSVVSRQKRSDGDHMTEIIRKHLQAVIAIDTSDWHPSICIPAEVLARVDTMLEPVKHFHSGFIHLNLHASLPIREWGIENAIEFCTKLRQQMPDLGIVVSGDPGRISEDGKSITTANVAGVLLLPSISQLELCAVVREARIVVTPDTAVTHIASAERKPVVTLHYRKNEWYPYGVPHIIIYSVDELSVNSIDVDAVFASVKALLTD